MKTKMLILTAFCFALTCQRNIIGTDANAFISWEAFIESGTRDAPGYPNILFASEPICESLDEPYIIVERSFGIALYEFFTNESQMNKQYRFVVITKSGDIEQVYAPFHNANLIAHYYSELIKVKTGAPRGNNRILETNISNDSLAVRIQLDDGTYLIKIGPIFPNCPDNIIERK